MTDKKTTRTRKTKRTKRDAAVELSDEDLDTAGARGGVRVPGYLEYPNITFELPESDGGDASPTKIRKN